MSAAANVVPLYPSCSTKKKRRTAQQINTLCNAMRAILSEEHPTTVRHVFYRMVSEGHIAKSEREYDNVVVRLLTQMRKDGRIPFDYIADSTRRVLMSPVYYGIEDALYEMVQTYRRNIWDTADSIVEVWTEKDAMAGILLEVTDMWRVPLTVIRGFSGVSFLNKRATEMGETDKPVYVYYLGDYDPSGQSIMRVVERELREYADTELHFEALAVTPEQIEEMDLPMRPTKTTDSRSKNWEGGSVEVDALPPAYIKEIVEDHITQHLDADRVKAVQDTEKAERETLRRLAGMLMAGEGDE